MASVFATPSANLFKATLNNSPLKDSVSFFLTTKRYLGLSGKINSTGKHMMTSNAKTDRR